MGLEFGVALPSGVARQAETMMAANTTINVRIEKLMFVFIFTLCF
jgi:hypothetical protein